MSLPRDVYIGPPDYPAPWTTDRPLEGLRDTDEARIVSLAPDVCQTPMGGSMVPVPYPITSVAGDDANYTETVRFTGQRAMVLRSHTTRVTGDEAGTGGGVVSGTVGDICEPIGHAAQVRAEGSPVIRHLDQFHMNNRNTVGEAVFVRSTATYIPPTDDDPLPGSLRMTGREDGIQFAFDASSPEGQRLLREYLSSGGTGNTTPRAAETPRVGNTGRFGEPPSSVDAPRVAAERVLTLLGLAEAGFELGDRAGRWYVGPDGVIARQIGEVVGRGQVRPFSPQGYVIGQHLGLPTPGDEAQIDYANGLLSLKAGRPIDFRTMTAEELERLIEAPWPDADTLRDISALLSILPNTVTINAEEVYNRDGCIIGQFEDIHSLCGGGAAHHIVPDMVYRLDTRPETAADRRSTEDRIPNAPTFNQGMSICLTNQQHGRGPTGIHGRLRHRLNTLGGSSRVPGTAPIGRILNASVAALIEVPDLSEECKLRAAAMATVQVSERTGITPPGRTQERLPLSGEALRVLSQGHY